MTLGLKQIGLLLLISGLSLESVAMDSSSQASKKKADENVFHNTGMLLDILPTVTDYLKSDWVLKKSWHISNNSVDAFYLSNDRLGVLLENNAIKVIDLKSINITDMDKQAEYKEREENYNPYYNRSLTRCSLIGGPSTQLNTDKCNAQNSYRSGIPFFRVSKIESDASSEQEIFVNYPELLITDGFNVSPDENFFIFITTHNINIVNMRNNYELRKIQVNSFHTALAMSHDSKYIVAGLGDGRIHLYDMATEKYLAVQEASTGARITSLVFSQDGTYILSGDSSGNVKLWQNQGTQLRNNIASSR